MREWASKPKPHEGVWLWMIKIFTGLLIVVLLAVHFLVNHLFAPEGLLTYNEILVYYSNPLIPVMEIAFLGFVVPHALIGTRSILLDLNPSSTLMRVIDGFLILLGIAGFAYGAWLIVVIASRAAAL